MYWLEKSGYDITYISDTDLDQQPSLLLTHKLYISGSHAEYVSAGMRTAMTQARDAKVNLFFSGSNTDYWKIRFEASPTTSRAGRTLVCYKTTAGGPVDPQGPTGLWRDKAGANLPENALIGQQYTGDDDFSTYPMIVNTTQGKDRVGVYRSRHPGAGRLDELPGDRRLGVGRPGEQRQRAAGRRHAGELAGLGEHLHLTALQLRLGQRDRDDDEVPRPERSARRGHGDERLGSPLALNAEGAGQIQWTFQQATTNILADMERTRPRLPPTSCSTRRERRR